MYVAHVPHVHTGGLGDIHTFLVAYYAKHRSVLFAGAAGGVVINQGLRIAPRGANQKSTGQVASLVGGCLV